MIESLFVLYFKASVYQKLFSSFNGNHVVISDLSDKYCSSKLMMLLITESTSVTTHDPLLATVIHFKRVWSLSNLRGSWDNRPAGPVPLLSLPRALVS